MFSLNGKQILSVVLASLMVYPYPMQAGSPAAIVGSMNSYGPVMVGENTTPAESTLFAGDLVNTHSGNAVVRYTDGARVLLAKSSTAVFSPKSVELQQGQMSFQTVSSKDVVFRATSLRLEPMTEKTSADVTVKDGKATISVTEGSVRAVDPSGASLAVIPAGEAKLFAMAVPPAASAAAAASASASASAAPLPAGAMVVWVLVWTTVAGGVTYGVYQAITSDNEVVVERRALSPATP